MTHFAVFALVGISVACGSLKPSGIKREPTGPAAQPSTTSSGGATGDASAASGVAKTTCLVAGSMALLSAPTYLADIKPLLAQYCLNCHGAGLHAPELATFSQVQAVGSAVVADVVNGTMPKGAAPLSSTQVALFSAWQGAQFPEGTTSSSGSGASGSQGAPVNCATNGTSAPGSTSASSSTSAGSVPPPIPDTPEQHVQKLITAYCVGCHGVGGSSPNLSTYDRMVARAASISEQVQSGEMPRGSTLPADAKTAIVNWARSVRGK